MAEESLYVEYRDGKPVAYRYGEPWVSMQLLVEGGFATEEEAREEWAKYKEWKKSNED
jgi:hypothetical protein